MVNFNPVVVDIYHGDVVEGNDCVQGFQKAKDAGIVGVIHKATQSTGIADKLYDSRREACKKLGLLWGAYHFNSGVDVKSQVDFFVKNAEPDDETLMVLDYEDNQKSQMSPAQMVRFLRLLEEKLGRKGVIYSGNRLKETISKLSKSDRDYVTSHRLWICQYGPKVVLPAGFSEFWLHQYTGDGVGPSPHYVPGITVPGGKGIDLNRIQIPLEDFKKTWK